MQPITLYVHRNSPDGGGTKWAAESYTALKKAFEGLGDGMFKIFIQQVKRPGGWRYKYHFGHVLPMIVEYMNRKEINVLHDPLTGESIPIDIDSLHNYHKQMFNPALIKNVLNRKNANGIAPEFIPIPNTTTKMNDGDFINRYEEEIISTYANQYGIEFLSREEYRVYFEDGKDSRMIVEMQMEIMQ